MATNIRLSEETSNFADTLVELGYFDSKITACKFAFAYAIKECSHDLRDPEALDKSYPPGGSNYKVGSVDNDGFIEKLVRIMFPNVNDTVLAMRGIMLLGLTKLEELHKANSLLPLSRHMIND